MHPLISAVLSMEGSIHHPAQGGKSLVGITSLQEKWQQANPKSALKKSLHLQRKMLCSVYWGCQCQMHGTQR